MAAEKLVKLESSDGEVAEETEVASESMTIKNVLEATQARKDKSCPIPLSNLSSKILVKVIEYCKYHVDIRKKTSEDSPPTSKDEIDPWEAEFLKIDWATLIKMIEVANFLNIPSLLELCCKEVADMMKGKTVEEIRSMFNIKSDFTPEEEEKIRRDNAWAFESAHTSFKISFET